MSQLFLYLYNCNKRKIAIIYFGFITVSLILLFNMKGVSGVRISGRQDIIIIIFFYRTRYKWICNSFNRYIVFSENVKNSMLRYTSISAKSIYVQIVYSVYYSL